MELKQYLKMSQQLVMTPQLQQAIKLLQLSQLELAEVMHTELTENPLLETDAEAMSTADVDSQIEQEHKGKEAPEERPVEEAAKEPAEMDWETFVERYNEYSYTPGASAVRYGDDDLPTLDQTLASKESLADHLEWQLAQEQFTAAEERLAEEIIGNLRPDGYIDGTFFKILAEQVGLELDEAEAVLEVIQEFDPIGVASRSLSECLLVQAKHHYPHEDVVHALIERHLENLEKRQVQPILKDLQIEIDDIADAMQIIASLEPKPGRGFGEDRTHYITPDVYVIKDGDDYRITLNEDGLPKLRISSFYEKQIKSGSAKGEEKDFIQDKFRSAVWLIRSIHQRQSTIKRVTESITRFQREFLDQGVAHLRPLILRDVADDIGMHESTISRVTTNKYVHTPQGIYELKYFFNSRITSSTGEDLASESVKQAIKKLIDAEDSNKPLSDQKLCNILGEDGTHIARRTVAKYREMLGIPPSSKRKKVF
jgi:RNA polymerase sigma-54 factor